MRIGRTFDKYVDLKWKAGLEGVASCSGTPASRPSPNCFPCPAPRLQRTCVPGVATSGPSMLDLLVEEGVVKLTKRDTWTAQDIERATEHLRIASCSSPTPRCARTEFSCRAHVFDLPKLLQHRVERG